MLQFLYQLICKIGNKISGNNATTGIGKASVTHHVIINTATDKTIQAFFPTEKGFTK